MKKNVILFLGLMLMITTSCTKRKVYSLGVSTSLILEKAQDRDHGYRLYDPFTGTYARHGNVFDTVYAGSHQLIAIKLEKEVSKDDIIGVTEDSVFYFKSCNQTIRKEILDLHGNFLASTFDDLFIFQSGKGRFYVFHTAKGYKWYASNGNEGYFISDKKMARMLKVSRRPYKYQPYCLFIPEEYDPVFN